MGDVHLLIGFLVCNLSTIVPIVRSSDLLRTIPASIFKEQGMDILSGENHESAGVGSFKRELEK